MKAFFFFLCQSNLIIYLFKNTIFFELERNWTGILIEPVPSFYKSIVSKKRNIFSINACIANEKPIIAKFRIFKSLSGRLKEMNEASLKRIDKESGSKIVGIQK